MGTTTTICGYNADGVALAVFSVFTASATTGLSLQLYTFAVYVSFNGIPSTRTFGHRVQTQFRSQVL